MNFFETKAEQAYKYIIDHLGQDMTRIAEGMGEKAPGNISKQVTLMVQLGLLARDPKTRVHTEGEVSVGDALKDGKIKPKGAGLR